MRMRRVSQLFDGTGRYIYQCLKCKSIEVTGALVCYCEAPSCLEQPDGPPHA